ncbi:MAG TPA: rRNA pseudouridine synthase [Leptolyngbyaceae cyanobacterium M65_K2018_010]|nr:rRNA pseudouridine synthase [Leptolyngbyaceae cyanobacterium M65_K2018_010]
MKERLQKILAQHGLASRRQAEEWIQAGRVTVNGCLAHLGQKVDPASDLIAVDASPLLPQQRPQPHYLLLHKPLGMVSTCADPAGRPTVLQALPADLQNLGLHPVGRLDAYSTGALLLTNDGDFTYRLTHPKHDVAKTYLVNLEGPLSEQDLTTWRQGVLLDGRLTRPAQIHRLEPQNPSHTRLKITLYEGRNRQIRRIAQAFGHRVLSLHRVAVGAVHLGNLKSGAFRTLSSDEIEALLAESNVQPTVSPPSSPSLVSISPYS